MCIKLCLEKRLQKCLKTCNREVPPSPKRLARPKILCKSTCRLPPIWCNCRYSLSLICSPVLRSTRSRQSTKSLRSEPVAAIFPCHYHLIQDQRQSAYFRSGSVKLRPKLQLCTGLWLRSSFTPW